MQQVVVQLFNGLGNQLFQYAAGRSLAANLGASLKLVHAPTTSSTLPRPILLQQFAVRAQIGLMSRLDRLAVSSRRLLQVPGRVARTLSRIQLLRQSPDTISQPFDFEIDSGARSIYLSGYFHEYPLVDEVAALLRRELVLKQPLHPQNQEYAQRIRSARRPISIHVRRGDYLTTFGPNGVLPMSYYERAIRHMLDQFPDASFFVFSDDAPFARFWARSHARMTVVEGSDSAHAHECLHLMSLCRHHIIANSTFSWWGAWLNARPDRQVVAPDHWLGRETSRIPMACPDWQLLSVDRPLEPPVPARIKRRA